MHLALPGDWYILLTGATADTCDSRPDWREPWLTMGLYNDDSQPIRTKLVNSEYGGARIRIEELETLTREYAKLAADKFGSGDVSQPRSFHWQL